MLKLANEEHSLEDIELQVSILVELEKVIAFPPMALTITSTLTPTPHAGQLSYKLSPSSPRWRCLVPNQIAPVCP